MIVRKIAVASTFSLSMALALLGTGVADAHVLSRTPVIVNNYNNATTGNTSASNANTDTNSSTQTSNAT